MRVKKLYERHELFLYSGGLEEKIAADNEVRLIDTFVDALDIESGDFTIRHKKISDPGAPEYHPADLLKITLVIRLKNVIKSI